MPCAAYQPRDAERGVLDRVVEAHLDAFTNGAPEIGTRPPGGSEARPTFRC